MYFLNTKNDGGGRWLRWSFENGHTAVNLEIYPFRREFAIEVDFRADCDRTILFTLKLPFLFSAYLSFDTRFGYSMWWSQKFLRLDSDRRYDGRGFGIRWCSPDGDAHNPLGTIDIKLGRHLNCWKSSDPRWMDIVINPNKWVFGKRSYTSNTIGEDIRWVVIPGGYSYDEKSYLCKCVMTEDVWSFQRFKKPLKLTRTEVSCEEGVPHPGKGTCEYNCGEDRLFSSNMCCDNFDEAFDEFKNAVLDMRKRYPL